MFLKVVLALLVLVGLFGYLARLLDVWPMLMGGTP
jgi:hypothetical protein